MCFLRNKVSLIIIIIIIIIIISSLNFGRKTYLTEIKKCHLGQPFTETDFWHKRQL